MPSRSHSPIGETLGTLVGTGRSVWTTAGASAGVMAAPVQALQSDQGVKEGLPGR